MKLNLKKVGIKFTEMNVDVDKNKMVSGLMQVRGLPTLVITDLKYKSDKWPYGKPQHSFPGVRPVYELEEIKKKYAKM